jgi:hypothetical protein
MTRRNGFCQLSTADEPKMPRGLSGSLPGGAGGLMAFRAPPHRLKAYRIPMTPAMERLRDIRKGLWASAVKSRKCHYLRDGCDASKSKRTSTSLGQTSRRQPNTAPWPGTRVKFEAPGPSDPLPIKSKGKLPRCVPRSEVASKENNECRKRYS